MILNAEHPIQNILPLLSISGEILNKIQNGARGGLRFIFLLSRQWQNNFPHMWTNSANYKLLQTMQ